MEWSIYGQVDSNQMNENKNQQSSQVETFDWQRYDEVYMPDQSERIGSVDVVQSNCWIEV